MKHATLRQLKVFEAVARLLSFSRAAEELHLTQPAVSTQVAKLAEHAGNPLFEQFGKKIYLTAAGTELLQLSRTIIGQFEAAEVAMARFRGISGGRLDVGVISAGIAKVLESIQQFDIEHQVLDFNSARQRFPQHRFDPEELVILDHESGFLRPELAVSNALRRARDLGATLHSHTRVEAIEPRDGAAWLRINGAERRFDKVLVTAGAWVNRLLPLLGPALYARKLILSWFPARDIAAFSPERFPIFTRRSQGYFSFGVPSIEGSMVKIGISTPGPAVEDVEAFDSQISEHELAETRHVIQHFLNGLDPDPVRTSGHLDAFSADRHCVIGHLPGQERLLLVGGFSGHGFKLAPALGEIASQLLQDRRPSLAIDAFTLERLASRPGGAHAF